MFVMNPVIAIDGPSCSGKGTIASMLAKRFNFVYLDTGMFYRAFACICFAAFSKFPDSDCIKIESIEKLFSCIEMLERYKSLKKAQPKSCEIVFSKDVVAKYACELIEKIKALPQDLIRSERVGMMASKIAKKPEIRDVVNTLVREFSAASVGNYNGTIMDGRDIGTCVFPKADCKIYMTADLKKRALRRFCAAEEMHQKVTFEEVYENLKKRDEYDASHLIDPLTFDKNYIIVDTSTDSVEDTFSNLVKIIENKFNL